MKLPHRLAVLLARQTRPAGPLPQAGPPAGTTDEDDVVVPPAGQLEPARVCGSLPWDRDVPDDDDTEVAIYPCSLPPHPPGVRHIADVEVDGRLVPAGWTWPARR